MTKTALQDFQKRNGLTRTGSLDTDTYVALFAKSAVRAAAGTAISRVTGPRLLATAEAYGALTGWKEIDPIFAEGTRATVQDLYTGYTYEVIRTGGRHHADVQPVGEEALSVYQKCFGGSYTWENARQWWRLRGRSMRPPSLDIPMRPNRQDTARWRAASAFIFMKALRISAALPRRPSILPTFIWLRRRQGQPNDAGNHPPAAPEAEKRAF